MGNRRTNSSRVLGAASGQTVAVREEFVEDEVYYADALLVAAGTPGRELRGILPKGLGTDEALAPSPRARAPVAFVA